MMGVERTEFCEVLDAEKPTTFEDSGGLMVIFQFPCCKFQMTLLVPILNLLNFSSKVCVNDNEY